MTNSTGSVAIFWDIENCPPPSKMSGTYVERRLREEIGGYGPIRQVFAYAELARVPSKLRLELQRAGIHLIDTPHERDAKDVADHMIITDMFIYAMENLAPQTVVLVAGDIDYAYSLAKLRQRDYRIILIVPPVGVNPLLRERADIILEWSDIMNIEGDGAEKGTLTYDPLLSTLKDLAENGIENPLLSQVAVHIDGKYPGWKRTSGFDSVEEYVDDARLNGWVSVWIEEGQTRINISEDEPDVSDDFDLESDRFNPLLTVLQQLSKDGEREPELALIGIKLRLVLPNPLEKLGVARLKNYVQEAENAGLVSIRRDGVQHYVTIVSDKAKHETLLSEVRTLDLLEQALASLQEDAIMPTVHTLLGRMNELGQGWRLRDSPYKKLEALLDAAEKDRGVTTDADGVHVVVHPASGRFESIDPNSEEDPYSNAAWKSLLKFLRENPNMRIKGRYRFAKRIQEAKLKSLSKLKLGCLIHIVQLAINRGAIGWYGSVDSNIFIPIEVNIDALLTYYK
ncbi:MAG: NYN domain-containing protein [Candidatus Thorarchaeota archaeon]